ncbi:hypothetical protein JI435_409250, partial [Parastagonospora nodorum SN15]
ERGEPMRATKSYLEARYRSWAADISTARVLPREDFDSEPIHRRTVTRGRRTTVNGGSGLGSCLIPPS